jgi:hypothetical protein
LVIGSTSSIIFEFAPLTPLPISQGYIQIEVPLWAQVIDQATGELIDKYPFEENELNCTSPSFEKTNTTISGSNLILISYNKIFNEYEPIKIECLGWKNPIEPTIVNGFKLSTYTKKKVMIDNSMDFSLDAYSFSPQLIS